MVGAQPGVGLDIGGGVALSVQVAEDLLGRIAQFDAQVIDQLQGAIGAELGVHRHLRVGRAATHQRAA
ncbi:hypothetical protein [Pseudomonas sp. PvP001]|uniref:hypothetical protein n=1 Tax=Pseudomonas sp. PvP001 TaxID=3158559 RepID=UPI0033978305